MSFKAATCPNCGGSLQIPSDFDTVKCMYCGSEITVRAAIRLAVGRVREFTEATAEERIIDESKPFPLGEYKRHGYAVIAIGSSIGLILILLAGEFGLLMGGVILIAALMMGAVTLSKVKKLEEANEAMSKVPPRKLILKYRGKCPYCDTLIWLPPVPGADCPACNKRIVIRDSKFHSVDTPISGLKKPLDT
jgi:DNA-directed RNA polymerase subunit RPC12/RpoP